MKTPTYLTYNEWQERGRHVVKGAKSSSRDKSGTALFHRNQTAVTQTFSYARNPDPYAGYDDQDYTLTAFDIGADF